MLHCEDLDQLTKSARGHPRSRHAASARASTTRGFVSTESPRSPERLAYAWENDDLQGPALLQRLRIEPQCGDILLPSGKFLGADINLQSGKVGMWG